MAKGISETAFASQVEHLLKLFHRHWCHFRPALTGAGWRTAMTGHKGITDYIAARPPRLIFAELKDEVKENTPEQEEWQNILRGCQRVILNQPMTVQGKVATLSLNKPVDMLMTPEVYLWRPSQFEEIAEILR